VAALPPDASACQRCPRRLARCRLRPRPETAAARSWLAAAAIRHRSLPLAGRCHVAAGDPASACHRSAAPAPVRGCSQVPSAAARGGPARRRVPETAATCRYPQLRPAIARHRRLPLAAAVCRRGLCRSPLAARDRCCRPPLAHGSPLLPSVTARCRWRAGVTSRPATRLGLSSLGAAGARSQVPSAAAACAARRWLPETAAAIRRCSPSLAGRCQAVPGGGLQIAPATLWVGQPKADAGCAQGRAQ
jgi:hypothetical protein